MMTSPKPMPDPCLRCEKRETCDSNGFYLCPRFCEFFCKSWDETTAWLREVLKP